MKNFLKSKPRSFYCGLVGGAVGLVCAAVYLVYSYSVRHLEPTIFMVMLLGALSCALLVFTKWKFASLIPAILFSISFGMYLNDRVIMFEEMINQIYGMSERGAILEFVLLVFALNFIAFIACSIAAFSKDKQNKKRKKRK